MASARAIRCAPVSPPGTGAPHRRASPALVRDYLGREAVRKLHIGASDKSLPGWLNTDIERHPGVAYLDCTRPFPFESDTFDYVYSEHFIEHLERDQGVACLREVLRCLKPGGVFRLATPDLEQYVGLFAQLSAPSSSAISTSSANCSGSLPSRPAGC